MSELENSKARPGPRTMSPISFRIAAVAAALSAVTTFLLWLLPRLYEVPDGLEAAVGLHQNPVYLSRLWVNFVHIFLALAAYGATAVLLWRRSPSLAGFGFVCFLLWGFVELSGVSVNIFAVNADWRAHFALATPEGQGQLRVLLLGFDAVWDALFFLLLTGFLLGTSCFGLAALAGTGLERWVGVMFLLASPLTLAIMLGGYAGVAFMDSIVSWLYPVLQPFSRALLAAWLWQAGVDDSSKSNLLHGST